MITGRTLRVAASTRGGNRDSSRRILSAGIEQCHDVLAEAVMDVEVVRSALKNEGACELSSNNWEMRVQDRAGGSLDGKLKADQIINPDISIAPENCIG